MKNVEMDAKSIVEGYEPAQIKGDPDLQKLVAELNSNSLIIKSVDQ